ncbi:MAG: phosphoribosyltransferase [Candidatus Peregrinibacteria bacterium GW2011_GWF2_43_17]|nr:MAG: phosphoribosyltransferase [Candidatus Peregrinibacteria bacterium GW2011_GWF2_43_17]KKT18531.1 MAG: Phosphoribosyltransferase [Candidatus Peregrinibacteria bacterium GW2011_GWA2_43_8]HAU39839.1 hypothetical protein [Candidatus Peregrinibacteria bacterium]
MRVLNSILNIIFPKKCVCCERDGDILCRGCFLSIKKVCRRISLPHLDFVCAIYRYENSGVLQKVIKSMKYRFLRDIPRLFEYDILDFLEKNFDKSSFVLVPVPLHPKREKWRGFNQSFELIKNLDWQIVPAIKRTRNTKPQAELARYERLENLNGAFTVHPSALPKLLNKKIILVDDVCTTGTTLSECARVLKGAGVKEVYAVVLGHGG